MDIKISVIVPIYNVEKYLSKCIDSIINQTYKNLQIILVNDGSEDSCSKICHFYCKKDNRIQVIDKKNGGLSDARNAGLDIATGEYVSFIDSDDYIHKKFYETLVKLINRYDADIAECKFLKVLEENTNEITDDVCLNDEKIKKLNSNEALNNLYNENYVNTVVVWNKLYKKDLFNYIRYPKGKIHEDEYTTYKVLFNASTIVSISKPLYYYLQRTNSIMGKEFNIKRLDVIEAYHEQVLFYNRNNLIELKDKANIRFENLIRTSMCRVMKSNLDNKNKLLRDLIAYYRNNYTLFSNIRNINYKKKITFIMFKYSPNFAIRILCNLMNLKLKLTE